ncbi:insulinase family protein [Candidatus Woesearchaeota archaeon]|nr:insulinase family protein [Candidatus Woesearchaeota archaeon]
MQKVVLPNGLKIIFEPKKGNSVVVEALVKVGSNYESPSERGVSHFIEHMLFEGTAKRPTSRDISNEIEKVGGEFNAYTTNERTCFYVKVLKKHFPIAVEVLADILQHSLFKEEELEKEKNVVLKEIDLVNDEPKFYQWILFQKNLYEKHPAKYPTYGRKQVIKSLTREKVLNYFNRYYLPNNMIISVVGETKNWNKLIAKYFTSKRNKVIAPYQEKEHLNRKKKEVKESKDVTNTYLVLGFKTVPKNHPDSYVLEVIDGILGRGQSGRMFTEIRSKKGLAYDVGTQHIAEISFGYFAVYATIDGKNLDLVKKLLLKELGKLRQATEKDIQEAKTYIEGDYYLDLEDTQKVADQFLFWEQTGGIKLMKSFIAKIKRVTRKDIIRVVDKYFKNYTLVVIKGK